MDEKFEKLWEKYLEHMDAFQTADLVDIGRYLESGAGILVTWHNVTKPAE